MERVDWIESLVSVDGRAGRRGSYDYFLDFPSPAVMDQTRTALHARFDPPDGVTLHELYPDTEEDATLQISGLTSAEVTEAVHVQLAEILYAVCAPAIAPERRPAAKALLADQLARVDERSGSDPDAEQSTAAPAGIGMFSYRVVDATDPDDETGTLFPVGHYAELYPTIPSPSGTGSIPGGTRGIVDEVDGDRRLLAVLASERRTGERVWVEATMLFPA